MTSVVRFDIKTFNYNAVAYTHAEKISFNIQNVDAMVTIGIDCFEVIIFEIQINSMEFLKFQEFGKWYGCKLG